MLSKKVVTLYQLAGDQLPRRAHYDWSLRSMKPVLKLAGKMRYEDGIEPGETILLIRAIAQINLPKLIADDIPLFAEIIKVSFLILFRSLSPYL